MSKICKLIQKKILNAFVAVVSEKNEYVLRYIVVKNSDIVDKDEKRFAMDEDKKLSSDMIKFLEFLQKKYKFVYIIYLLDTLGQGCLPSCHEDTSSKTDKKKDIFKVCVDDEWAVYASKADIRWIEKIFIAMGGLDFIYSPYMVLNNFVNKMKNCDKKTLHFAYSEDFIALLIYDAKKVIFSAFFKIPYKEFNFEEDDELKPESDEDITEGIDLEDIESEDEEFEGFVDITKLDDDDAFESKKESDILDLAKTEVESSTLDDLELYGREMMIFKYLQSAIEEYYKNDIYDSEFLEDIIIYNDSNISNDIITMIENDLFLNVEIRSIDVKEEMINMSIEEVGL